MPTKTTKEETIEIPRIEIGYLEILLIGDSPLIMHKWSEKAKKEMLDKQMKVAKKGREAKDPQKDYEDSIYYLPESNGTPRYGFPSVAFKNAAVSACRFTEGTKMTVARGAFHVEGEFVEITNSSPVMREDMVKIGMGVADIRYRAEFSGWQAKVRVSYNKHALSREQIVNLFNLAGFGVGCGEWRPERDGSFGRFHVGTEDEITQN